MYTSNEYKNCDVTDEKWKISNYTNEGDGHLSSRRDAAREKQAPPPTRQAPPPAYSSRLAKQLLYDKASPQGRKRRHLGGLDPKTIAKDKRGVGERLYRGIKKVEDIRVTDHGFGQEWPIKRQPDAVLTNHNSPHLKDEACPTVDWSADLGGGGDTEPDWPEDFSDSSPDEEWEGETTPSILVVQEVNGDFDLWAKIFVAIGILFIGALYGTILPL